MINDKDFALVESYLEGDLTEEAKTLFEKRLKEEEELQKYLALIIESDRFLEGFNKEQKIEEWKEVLQKESILDSKKEFSFLAPLKNIKHSQLGRYALSIAAMLLVFVTIYLLIPSNNSPEQLASHYWTETAQFSYADARRGDTPKTIENTTKKIYTLHKTGYYEEALKAIEELSVPDEKMILLKGSCYYNMDEIDKAVEAFQQITTLQNSYTEDEAKWYLALCYLKKGNVEKGKKELQEIIVKKRWNHKYATKILKEI